MVEKAYKGTKTDTALVSCTRTLAWSGVGEYIIGDAKRSRFRRMHIFGNPAPKYAFYGIMEGHAVKNKSLNQRKKERVSKHREQINLYAAGIDVGSEMHYVAVPEGLDDEPVRSFNCFTGDLEQLSDWLVKIGIQTVVMESTGVYWIPIFEILEERGLEVLLVNAHHVKNVSGRKSDVLDCQWLQQLHT